MGGRVLLEDKESAGLTIAGEFDRMASGSLVNVGRKDLR